jgi:hypothetical protein
MIAALKGFTQQFVAANGIRINAVTGGEGPPIVLLHGFPQAWWEWHQVMPLLAERVRVVAGTCAEQAFCGRPLDGYDKATLAHDVHEVMTAPRHQRYAVCGHDIGGMITTAMIPPTSTFSPGRSPFPGGHAAASNGTGASPPIMPRHSNTRSNRLRCRCWRWAETQGSAHAWSRCSRSSPAT